MSKMYYISYETAKQQLELAPENEAQDRIILVLCNQLVKDALEDINFPVENKQKFLESIVLKVYERYRSYETCNEKQLVEIYSEVKELLV